MKSRFVDGYVLIKEPVFTASDMKIAKPVNFCDNLNILVKKEKFRGN